MITIKVNETNVDVIKSDEVLYTFCAYRQSENISAAYGITEELFPYEEVNLDESGLSHVA